MVLFDKSVRKGGFAKQCRSFDADEMAGMLEFHVSASFVSYYCYKWAQDYNHYTCYKKDIIDIED